MIAAFKKAAEHAQTTLVTLELLPQGVRAEAGYGSGSLVSMIVSWEELEAAHFPDKILIAAIDAVEAILIGS
jgi:hypothetical protein